MKAYVATVLVVDLDDIGKENTILNLEYARGLCWTDTLSVEEYEIGEWRKEHPLRFSDKRRKYIESLKSGQNKH